MRTCRPSEKKRTAPIQHRKHSACSRSSAGVTMKYLDVDVILEVSLRSRVLLQPSGFAL